MTRIGVLVLVIHLLVLPYTGIASVVGRHPTVTNEEGCTSATCHNDLVETKRWGRRDGHQSLGDATCISCHDIEDNEQPPFFRYLYENTSRIHKGGLESFELCWTCHDRHMAAMEYSADSTAFRDGEKNLHFLHVVTAEKRSSAISRYGITCSGCHSMHRPEYPHLIRCFTDRLACEWSSPYEHTLTGGSCAYCHRSIGYDRNSPTRMKQRSGTISVNGRCVGRITSIGTDYPWTYGVLELTEYGITLSNFFSLVRHIRDDGVRDTILEEYDKSLLDDENWAFDSDTGRHGILIPFVDKDNRVSWKWR